MNREREISGQGLAVCDYIDFLGARDLIGRKHGSMSGFTLTVWLVRYPKIRRGFIRTTDEIGTNFASLIQASMEQ